MCSWWKLGSSVVVTACRRAAPRLRVVHVDADTAAIVHHLDAIDAASVGLHALGVDHPAAGAALDPAHRVGQAVVAARAALPLPPLLGFHRLGPGRVAHALDAFAPATLLALATDLVLAPSTAVSAACLGPGAPSRPRQHADGDQGHHGDKDAQ